MQPISATKNPNDLLKTLNSACIISNAVLNPIPFTISFVGGVAIGFAEAGLELTSMPPFQQHLLVKYIESLQYLSWAEIATRGTIEIGQVMLKEPSSASFTATALFPFLANISNIANPIFSSLPYLSGIPLGRPLGSFLATVVSIRNTEVKEERKRSYFS